MLDEIYKLLHPFMTFMTEELWSKSSRREGFLCHSRWPVLAFEDTAAAEEINWLIDLISGIRSTRAEMNIPPKSVGPLIAVNASREICDRLLTHTPAINRLARVEDILLEDVAPRGSAQIVVNDVTYCLPLGDLMDLAAEKARLEKALEKISSDIDKSDRKLGNEKFLSNAHPDVVESEREKQAELTGQREKIISALTRIAEAQSHH